MGSKINATATQLKRLIEVGLALSSEKELSRLIQLLLENSMEATQSEGASVYIVENEKVENSQNSPLNSAIPMLKFYKSTNRNLGQQERSGVLPVNEKSIAGYVTSHKKPLNIPDCYNLPADAPYTFNKSYDQKFGYRSQSMLAIPMISANGKVRGVIQLLNKLDDQGMADLNEKGIFQEENVIPFDQEDEEIISVFASHAAIALENADLTDSIQNLFESFVRASVKAIEARDPTTSGHSDRVAMMTVELALAAHKCDEGPYKKIFFSEDQIREIRYAALLHDFGKIGVPEPILLKKKKLYDRQLESILNRLDKAQLVEENQLWNQMVNKLMILKDKKNEHHHIEELIQQTQQQIKTVQDKVKLLRGQVITANEPQILSEDFNIAELIKKLTHNNQLFHREILALDEIKNLSISRGSLNEEERKHIESHVSHTYDFLKQIAWTDDLSNITQIAHCHHEKIDGTGYPRGIQGDQIPVQARMMTIADIYDALTAFDRPYKKSLSASQALEVLIKDARGGKIDGFLLKVFIESGVFHRSTTGQIQKQAG